MMTFDPDFFGDGLRIFLSYIERQLKQNPEYKPHPIIRAIEIALSSAEEAKVGEIVAGMSSEGTEDSVYETYLVVIEKKGNQAFEIKEITNLNVGKQMPIHVMLLIFRLQIRLDNLEGDFVNSEQAVEVLNEIFPGTPFFALGDRWEEARNRFRDLLEQGKASVPNDPELIGVLKNIRYDTPWEDYPSNLRALIGQTLAEEMKAKVVITSPSDAEIEKYKVFDIANQLILGGSSEYLNLLENLGKDE